MIIQNNIPGINASRNKGITEGKLKKSLEKLSTGYRINRAGDDAAGLAISEIMRKQIGGLNQAMKNTNDGIGLTQVGDGALMEVHSMLERMNTLATQSANGTYTTAARENLNFEVEQLLDEIDRIGLTTNFDDIPLFDGETTTNILEPPELAKVGGEQITLQIGYSQPETLDVSRYRMNRGGLGLAGINTTNLQDANAAIDRIKVAIEAVSDIRAGFGASQSHLEHTFQSLSVTAENVTSAESRIRDTDMADEFTSYTRDNIMHQAGNAMCAQANSIPQMILSLLQ